MRIKSLCLVVTCLLISATPVLSSSQCPSGVIGYWPFDGDGTEVVNSFSGDVVGGVTFAPGVSGQAAFFDGDFSYINAGSHPELTDFGGSAMSVAAWVYSQPDGPAGDTFSAVITSRTSCNEGNFQLYSSLGDQVYFSKWLDGSEDQVFSNAILPIGDWVHVVVTYATDEVRFYIDGALHEVVSPLVFGGAINDDLQDIQLGWDSCGSFFTGGLDEVAIFNVTLSAAEVEDLFVKGFNGLSVCADDADDDGVTDANDVCPFTAGTPLIDGCDCQQILAYKPGNGGNCNNGTLNVFEQRIGWAQGVPLPEGE